MISSAASASCLVQTFSHAESVPSSSVAVQPRLDRHVSDVV